ncbi:sugar nucleotide-binding protein [Streptosporangium sp. NPDC000239]|uniref:SDR family oxidoreductase n=1 Tax=Streptosporangium sp. NPDC000239 TaxID=3154248 RepID=UPI00332EF43F
MRICIVGASGFLGGELLRRAATGHVVAATYLNRPGTTAGADWLPLDVRDRTAVADLVRSFAPDVVVNAAYDQADWTTTALGAAHVAVATRENGGRLVHVSSDAVFSGRAITYTEDDVPDPITPYGAAKAAAEVAVQVIDPSALIARTSLIVGDGGSSHEAMVHSLAAGRTPGALFTDEVRCPVHVSDLASALLELAASGRSGVHHVAGADAVSRYDLGLLIAERDGLDPARLPSGRSADLPSPRPLDVRLDCSLTRRHLRTGLRGAREFLRNGA